MHAALALYLNPSLPVYAVLGSQVFHSPRGMKTEERLFRPLFGSVHWRLLRCNLFQISQQTTAYKKTDFVDIT